MRSSTYTLHFLNLLDLVLGVIVGLCGLLLFLKWQMMSLIWLWAPLMGIGGVSVLLVFTRCARARARLPLLALGLTPA